MPNEDIENFLWDLYPITIIMDRYCGTYSGGKYTAWNLENDEIPEEAQGDDISCRNFWYVGDSKYYLIGKGDTVQQAYEDLISKVRKLATEMENGLYGDTNYEQLTYYGGFPNAEEYENIRTIVREFNNKENNNEE